jgi:hypothetical protein
LYTTYWGQGQSATSWGMQLMISYLYETPAVANRGTRPLIITTCSASKRCRIGPQALGLREGVQAAVQRQWRTLLSSADAVLPAFQLYRGRAFGLALRTAEALSADLGIISAGLGYVLGATPIPSYDLTVRERAPGSVKNRIAGPFDLRAWWKSVAAGPFSANLLDDVSDRPAVLMCLSKNYAEMLSDELTAIVRHGVPLRVFGLAISSALPDAVRNLALPYDERLSAIGLAGTRVDFPQRAMMHYAEAIFASTDGSIDRERELVDRMLSDAKAVPQRMQHRRSDETIKIRIRTLMREIGPKRGKILAHLRRVDRISCEQQRFASLFSIVQSEVERLAP